MTLLEILKQLKNEVSVGNYPAAGICAYVKKYNSDPVVYNQMSRLMMCWPKSTKYEPFPVPASNSDRSYRSAIQTYMDAILGNTLWCQSEHAMLRHELLSWMIEQLEKQNEN